MAMALERSGELMNDINELGNTTLSRELSTNFVVALELLGNASQQVQAGDLTGANDGLQAAVSILDQVNVALSVHQEKEDVAEYEIEMQDKLAKAINETGAEISSLYLQLNSTVLPQNMTSTIVGLLETPPRHLTKPARPWPMKM